MVSVEASHKNVGLAVFAASAVVAAQASAMKINLLSIFSPFKEGFIPDTQIYTLFCEKFTYLRYFLLLTFFVIKCLYIAGRTIPGRFPCVPSLRQFS
jgi:hypothetical protein